MNSVVTIFLGQVISPFLIILHKRGQRDEKRMLYIFLSTKAQNATNMQNVRSGFYYFIISAVILL